MFPAIYKGNCPIHLSFRNPGPLSHSRWLTIANQILQSYLGKNHPTDELSHLAIYVMTVYVSVCFLFCKSNPSFKDEVSHVFQLIISKSRYT